MIRGYMKHIGRAAIGWYGGTRLLRSDKGIALVTVLVLSLISLAIVAALIFLVTTGSRVSGFNKRYETAREAGYGGIEVIRALIKKQGDLSSLKDKLDKLGSMTSSDLKGCDCGDTTDPDNVTLPISNDNCLCRKLCSPTLKTDGSNNWKTCDKSMDPTSNYDLIFELSGLGTDYDVYAKIVDTSLGNTDLSGLNLGGTAVVASSGTIAAPPDPYLYAIEITSQDKVYPSRKERARLSVLYAY
jgi:hypothetical protein